MATNREAIKSNYPLPVYNYRVEIDGKAMSFSEVSGLNMAYETKAYKESRLEGAGAPGLGPGHTTPQVRMALPCSTSTVDPPLAPAASCIWMLAPPGPATTCWPLAMLPAPTGPTFTSTWPGSELPMPTLRWRW